ncbi:RNA polymerase sigma factor [Hyphomicrobium sp.]|uniref:RNA polymerase sigma factor n=1 Tax=Hyphomicrobium sp. TaxID=82 RepID=UPI003F6FF94A
MHKHKPEPLETASDAELVSRALARDQLAVRTLIQRYNRRLYRAARSIVADDSEAEDVLQEAYLRAFAALGTFRAESTLATWLTRIVLNEAFQRVRRRIDMPISAIGRDGRQMQMADVIPFPASSRPAIDPERAMAQTELCRIVESAIDALPQDFRAVLVARVVEGMSVEETAAAFDLLPETVKTRLHRARKLLKDALAEHLGPHFGDVFPFDGKRCERITDAVVCRLGF